MGDSQILDCRFGSPKQYKRAFDGKVHLGNITNDLQRLETRVKQNLKEAEKHEISRQRFLKLLGRDKLFWQSAEEEDDLDVEISQIKNQEQILAFIRIHPSGFRSERTVPPGKEIFFYVLTGSVIFNIGKHLNRNVVQGTYVKVPPNAVYSIRGPCGDSSPAHLIFKVKDRVNKKNKTLNALQY